MSYKALYRTYRPSSFEEVVGQQHIVTTLKNAVKQNKIAHAYLFCGPRGTGKTSIAKLLAKAVNCEDQQNAPCNQCRSCLAIQQGNHPDIVEIDAASNNGVDEVRELIEKVKYAPLEGRYKVYIIDEVHMMSSGAFNALLKTLEEHRLTSSLFWQRLNRKKFCQRSYLGVSVMILPKSDRTKSSRVCAVFWNRNILNVKMKLSVWSLSWQMAACVMP